MLKSEYARLPAPPCSAVLTLESRSVPARPQTCPYEQNATLKVKRPRVLQFTMFSLSKGERYLAVTLPIHAKHRTLRKVAHNAPINPPIDTKQALSEQFAYVIQHIAGATRCFPALPHRCITASKRKNEYTAWTPSMHSPYYNSGANSGRSRRTAY